MSYVLKNIDEQFDKLINSVYTINERSGALTKKETMMFIADLQAGKLGKPKHIFVNADPSKQHIKNSANIKDVDKLTDADIKKVVGFIKGDGTLNACGSADNVNIIEDEFGIPDLKLSGGKFVKNDEGKYEYSFKGKAGVEAEKHLDEETLSTIFVNAKGMWKPIDKDLAALIASPKATKLETNTILPRYDLYALGALNTKTNLSLDDIFDGKVDEEYKAWKIADTLVINTKDKKYLSISNKLDEGVITIGGIPINEIRRCFKDYKDIDKKLGIDNSYVKLLKKMLVENKPITVDEKFVLNNAPINETVLGNFLSNLCTSIYRHGYIITETSKSGEINNWYPVKEDYVTDIQIIGCKFSVLSKIKRQSLKLPDPPAGKIWTLGFKIDFMLHGRKYTWDFRDHIGHGSLTVATVKRG